MKTGRFGVCGAALMAALGLAMTGGAARADEALADAILKGKPIIDLRLRYETVDDENCTACAGNTADAVTLRARLGYETGAWNGLSAAFDFDKIWALDEDYNSTRNGKGTRPVVADPDLIALNRLQISYASDFGTKFTLGRQRLTLGNQRFIGNVGWRQHEQTFDAISLVNTSIKNLTLTYAYIDQVNRVFGPDHPAPATGQPSRFDSDSHVIDAVYTAIPDLRVEAYAYLLDLDQNAPPPDPALRLSTATLGARGELKHKLTNELGVQLNGEYAHQTDYARNPLSLDLDYGLIEGALHYNALTVLGGYEILTGNGVVGFSTPLATLHTFNGWADIFLTTPANGLEDAYAKLAYIWSDIAAVKAITLTAFFHDFSAERTSTHYGSEIDASLDVAIDARTSALIKFASFDGDGPFRDKNIVWLQAGWKL
ncbi:MAG: alginate export family protein [Alphaproteobacteria bacterium]